MRLTRAEPALGPARDRLQLGEDWARRWSVTVRVGGGDVVVPARDIASLPMAGREPVRRFSWHRNAQHRSGLEFLVSTGRLHGFESLAEAKLLLMLMLDFAGGVADLLSQPLRLKFSAADGVREHVPDFFADTRTGRWLIDVRPAGRIAPRDEDAFAATAEAATLWGWGYRVVTGWDPVAAAAVEAFSAQRRRLTDRLGMTDALLDAVADGPRPFGELAAATVAPAVARAYLLHLLWHRRLTMDLTSSLTDHTLIGAAR
ncbi:TnsA-like heteromeric transposase endonuclease subunit [Amycolatopsis sp. H6(2020)]|nr:TnsA-like heteromeric transposase endonuclease subunit [Amycolatopsis sp. H6(2020)]